MTMEDHEMSSLTNRNHHNNNNYNLNSTICFPNNQMELLSAMLNNHTIKFQTILNCSAIDINHCYDFPYYKTLLEIACCENTKLEFIELLLRKGADPNLVNSTHKKAALHFSIDPQPIKNKQMAGNDSSQPKKKYPPNIDIIKLLLKQRKIDVNILSKGRTPVMYTIKLIEDNEIYIDRYTEVIRLLLNANADVNIPDLKDCTPIYIAAEKNYQKIVNLILEQSKMNVDLDSYKDRHNKTAREIIISKQLAKQLPKFNDKVLTERVLFRLLNERKENEFEKQLLHLKKNFGEDIVDINNSLYSLLQLACSKGLARSVDLLLEEKANPNLTHGGNLSLPIEICCEQGYYKILDIFLRRKRVETETKKKGIKLEGHEIEVPNSILHSVVKNINNDFSENEDCNYNICLDLLLDYPDIDVNSLDLKKNSPLHYAVRNSDQNSTLRLLRAGACVSIRNVFKQPPLADISAATLHKYLDECLTTNDQRCTDENYEIKFNYSFLVPPNNMKYANNQCSVQVDEPEIADNYLVPEIDALLYMTKVPDLRKLLKHPILTSFLFLKWQRISLLFYVNLIFYVLFYISLILYILIGYGQFEKNGDSAHTLPNILKLILLVGVVILTLRELFQFLVATKLYVRNIENWLELPLICLTFLIAFHEPEQSVRQQLSAIAILLSSAELILLIGQHPKLSTNIVMLRTVSWNFFKFLLWYSILIIAFALSFFILFKENNAHSTDPQNTTEPAKKDSEDDENFFLDPGMSLFKTIVMLTGEFDAGSINFKTFPVTSHLIFVMFVFLIAIVLFNLLNGLAVSDTQIIKNDAELVSYETRIKLISYFESMILGDWPPIARLLQRICCCVNITNSYFCLKPLAESICLFPNYLSEPKIAIKPNQGRTIILHEQEKTINEYSDYGDYAEKGCFRRWCTELKMDSRVIKAAKLVIASKNRVNEFDELKIMLSLLEKNLVQCEQQIVEKDKKLDEITKALHNITNILTNKVTSED